MQEEIIYYNLINSKIGGISKKLNKIYQWITYAVDETKNASGIDVLEKEYELIKNEITTSDLLHDINFSLDKFIGKNIRNDEYLIENPSPYVEKTTKELALLSSSLLHNSSIETNSTSSNTVNRCEIQSTKDSDAEEHEAITVESKSEKSIKNQDQELVEKSNVIAVKSPEIKPKLEETLNTNSVIPSPCLSSISSTDNEQLVDQDRNEINIVKVEVLTEIVDAERKLELSRDLQEIIDAGTKSEISKDLQEILGAGTKSNLSKEIKLQESSVNENDMCTFSHIESPSEFYIHITNSYNELTEELTREMNKNTTVKLQYKTKQEALNLIKKYCIMFWKSNWYRAEVLDWMMEVDSEIVCVQLVDFGSKEYCSYRTLQPISNKFLKEPKLAIRCHLAAIMPQSLTNITTNKWHNCTIKAFTQLSGINKNENSKINFKIVYVQKEGNSFGIHLHSEDADEYNTIAHHLVNLGLAVCSEGFSDDDDDDDDNMEQYSNINEAIAGYDAQDEARICRFTNSTEKCFKQAKCKLEHIPFSKSGFTTDKLISYSEAFNKICPPPIGININVKITGYINPCHFYVQLLNSQMINEKLQQLQERLNLDIVKKTYVPFKILPSIGELLLVLNFERMWCRAKLIKCNYDAVEVFLVDYGETCITNLNNIRKMKEEFLDLPFQAVECIIYNYHLKSDVSVEEASPFFEKYVISRSFKAVNMSRKFPLLLQLNYLTGLDMGVFLKEYGFVEETSATPRVDDNCSITAD